MNNEKKVTVGLVVVKHTTISKNGEETIYRVALRSGNKKTTLKLEIPEADRSIFAMFPKGDVFEMSLSEPSQQTLDAYEESNDDEEN